MFIAQNHIDDIFPAENFDNLQLYVQLTCDRVIIVSDENRNGTIAPKTNPGKTWGSLIRSTESGPAR